MIRRLPSSFVLRNIPVPPHYVVAFACGEVAQQLWPARVPGSRAVRIAAGGALVVAAVALIGWSLDATRTVDLEYPDRLVTWGPYALSRNPMYVAWAALAVGAGLMRNSMWMLAGTPIGATFVHCDVLREERELAVRHPERFKHYATAVPRYLPRRRPLSVGDRRPTSYQLAESLEDHRCLNAIATPEALTARCRRRDRVQPIAECGLGIDRLFQLRKIP